MGNPKNLNCISALAHLLSNENRIFIQAREGRRLSGILRAVLAIFVILAVSFVPFYIASALIFDDAAYLEDLWDGSFFLIGPFLVMIGALGLWIRLFEGRPFSSAGFKTPHFLKYYLIGLAIGFLMLASVIGMMAVAGSVEFDKATMPPDGVNLATGMLLMLAGYLAQGGAEEIMMRGWLFQVLGARYTPWIGLTVSTVLFVAFHGSTSIMANLNLALFSVFLAFYYLHEGSIWGAMGWHSGWNWAQSNVFGVTVSGALSSENSLINLRPAGPSVLSGGDFGPEASLFCTLAFLIGLMALAALSRRKKVAQDTQITSQQ